MQYKIGQMMGRRHEALPSIESVLWVEPPTGEEEDIGDQPRRVNAIIFSCSWSKHPFEVVETGRMNMTINRNNIAFLTSTFLLSASMVIWVDLFTFSKVAYLPAWTKVLPIPIMVPAYIAFFCLIPATFTTNTLPSSRVAIAKSVLLSPLAAIAIYALNPSHQNRFLFANALFNYVWIVLFHFLLPALLLVGTRTVFHYVHNHKHVRQRQALKID